MLTNQLINTTLGNTVNFVRFLENALIVKI